MPSASLKSLYNKTSEKLKTSLCLLVLGESGLNPLKWHRAPRARWTQVKVLPDLYQPVWVCVADGSTLTSVLPSKGVTMVQTRRALVMMKRGVGKSAATQELASAGEWRALPLEDGASQACGSEQWEPREEAKGFFKPDCRKHPRRDSLNQVSQQILDGDTNNNNKRQIIPDCFNYIWKNTNCLVESCNACTLHCSHFEVGAGAAAPSQARDSERGGYTLRTALPASPSPITVNPSFQMTAQEWGAVSPLEGIL